MEDYPVAVGVVGVDFLAMGGVHDVPWWGVAEVLELGDRTL